MWLRCTVGLPVRECVGLPGLLLPLKLYLCPGVPIKEGTTFQSKSWRQCDPACGQEAAEARVSVQDHQPSAYGPSDPQVRWNLRTLILWGEVLLEAALQALRWTLIRLALEELGPGPEEQDRATGFCTAGGVAVCERQ